MPATRQSQLPSIKSDRTSRPVPLRNALATRSLVIMGLRITLIIVIASIISYFHLYDTLQQKAITDLRREIALRGEAENDRFQLAEHQTTMVRDEFMRRLIALGDQDLASQFDHYFSRGPEGLVRINPEPNDSLHQARAFVQRDVDMTADLRRRCVVGLDMLDQWGPLLTNRFASGFILMPENVLLHFCPHEHGNAVVTNEHESISESAWRALISQNPNRTTVWTPVYYDALEHEWMVSCLSVGVRDQGWVMAAGHDLPITDLVSRTVVNHAAGTWSMIVNRQGNLLAHPLLSEQIARAGGNLALDATNDPQLKRIVDAAQRMHDRGPAVIKPSDTEALVGVVQITGPDWLLITVQPKSFLSSGALNTAQFILTIGGITLILELTMLAWILQRQIARPITAMVAATDQVRRGDFNVRLDQNRSDELGRLAASINEMAKAVGDRDSALANQFEELVTTKLAAENANRAKAEFLGTMSHELRTPLNGVIGMIELMLATELTPAQREFAETISLSGRTLLGIIDDILDFTKLDAGKLRLELRAVDLRQVVDEVAHLLHAQALGKGIGLAVTIAPNMPQRLYADPSRVRQVLTNLVGNAVKFTDHGAVTIALSCRQRSEGIAEIHLAVSDTGPGIAPDDIPRLGEKFRQLDNTFSRRHGGTGLGLAITKSLLELMGGELAITSTIGRGSTFTAIMRLRIST